MSRIVFFRQIWKAYFVSRLVKLAKKGNSTSFPGLAIEKRYPSLLKDLTQDFDKIILISGTNGKTTTRAVINHFYQSQSISICSNLGGANLVRGIATSLLLNRDFFGKPKSKIGIFEVEEASLPIITKYLKVNTLILTNLFRDQLDAYGEIDKTLDYFRQSLYNLNFPPKNTLTTSGQNSSQKFHTDLIINGEDGNLVDLVGEFGVVAKTFAIEADNTQKPKYESKFKNKNLDKITAVAKNISQHEMQTSFEIHTQDKVESIQTQLPGTYNIYNILAAYLATKETFKEGIKDLITSFKPAFGRGEKIKLKDQSLSLFLIKNPAGMDQVLNLIKDNFENKAVNLAICINDNIADGKDVSWLWDVDIENFVATQKIDQIYTSGNRALDMLLRLEYSNLEVEKNQAKEDFAELLKAIRSSKKDFLVLCNYTAMLEFRELLATKIELKSMNQIGN